MKKTVFMIMAGICLLCAAAVNTNAANAADAKKLVGAWDVTVADAPYGYQNFVVTVKEKNKQYLLDIKGDDLDLKDQKFSEKDGRLSGEVYVGEYVKITVWEENGKVKGLADTSMGALTMDMKKKTTKK
ncbi:MAG: hypothetical protein LBR50_01865 [Tannerella sp.]|jgi:hypothetical protein|nr:hypothetical protein [Tannerella sp.]